MIRYEELLVIVGVEVSCAVPRSQKVLPCEGLEGQEGRKPLRQGYMVRNRLFWFLFYYSRPNSDRFVYGNSIAHYRFARFIPDCVLVGSRDGKIQHGTDSGEQASNASLAQDLVVVLSAASHLEKLPR